MKVASVASMLSALLALFPACNRRDTPDAQAPTPEPRPNDVDLSGEAISKPEPVTPPPPVPLEDRKRVADAENAFGIELYRAMKPSGNAAMSPLSIHMALTMLGAGAAGDTRKLLEKTLHMPLDEASQKALGALVANGGIVSLGGEEVPSPLLTVANSLWSKRGYPVRAEYKQALSSRFHALIEEIDVTKPTEVAERINGWVKETTNNRIKDLIGPASINDLTRLILVNAVYFKGRWQDPFFEDQTKDKPFTLEDGKVVNVPTMMRGAFADYQEDQDVQVVAMPYWSGPDQNLGMVVVVPKKKNGLAAVERNLSAAKVKTWLATGKNATMVTVHLPRFKAEGSLPLKEGLLAIGLGPLFSDKADLSGIGPDLFVSDAIHKTFVATDEKGTEAAAATAIAMAGSAMPPKPVDLHVDRPFLYFIRDARTGAILFFGRINDPR